MITESPKRPPQDELWSAAQPPGPPAKVKVGALGPAAETSRAGEGHSYWLTVLNIAFIVAGVSLIFWSESLGDKNRWQPILLGLGLALAPGGALGLMADWFVFGTLIQALNRSTRALGDRTAGLQEEINSLNESTRKFDAKNQQLGSEIGALRVSTDFLKRSSELGLEMIYPDRGSALQVFTLFLREEATRKEPGGRIIIVGSSIKGLMENVKGFDTIIRDALNNEKNCELNILLTHPKYSKHRENQEDRPTGAIEDEIFEGIRRLESAKPADYPAPPHQNVEKKIKLYKGTPTCFMIVAGRHMLINPYSYEEEAYRSFCIEVKGVARDSSLEPDRTIYAQYLRAHFEKAWSRNAVPYIHYRLQGPDPNQAWVRESCYGDVFVVQDAGHFYLSVNLTGQPGAGVRGMPTSIRCQGADGRELTLPLPKTFSIRLFDARSGAWRSLDKDMGQLLLHPDRRRAKASQEIEGNLLNDYVMLGLFDAEEQVESPYKHADLAPESLRDQPLPLFFVWLEPQKPRPAEPAGG